MPDNLNNNKLRWDRASTQRLLRTNPLARRHFLFILFKSQTLGEQQARGNLVLNGVGFSSHDVFILTKIAKKKPQRYTRLFDDNILKDRLPKYWRQLLPSILEKSSREGTLLKHTKAYVEVSSKP